MISGPLESAPRGVGKRGRRSRDRRRGTPRLGTRRLEHIPHDPVGEPRKPPAAVESLPDPRPGGIAPRRSVVVRMLVRHDPAGEAGRVAALGRRFRQQVQGREGGQAALGADLLLDGDPGRAVEAMASLAEWCDGDPELLAQARADVLRDTRRAQMAVAENNHEAVELLELAGRAS